jgi:hypothetical protein
MRSVADELRVRNSAHVLRLSVPERIALALSLGDEDLTRFSELNRLDPASARARLRATRSRGRRASVAAFSESR